MEQFCQEVILTEQMDVNVDVNVDVNIRGAKYLG